MIAARKGVTDLMQKSFFVEVTKKHGVILVIPPTHSVGDVAFEIEVRVDPHPRNLELFLFAYLI